MGIPLVKIDKNDIKWIQHSTSDYLEKIHHYIVDQEKVGDVFLVVFKNEKNNRKIAHHGIIVDVAGASNEIFLDGCLIHLTAKAKTRRTKYHIHSGARLRSRFYEDVFLGKLLPPPLLNINKPREWAVQLEVFVSKRILRVFNG